MRASRVATAQKKVSSQYPVVGTILRGDGALQNHRVGGTGGLARRGKLKNDIFATILRWTLKA